jgi:small conductance mechanosensitive channel
VERVSLRTTRLRDDYGRVWYVPNGQITRVGNLSQGKATAIVDVTVRAHDDLDRVGGRLVDLGLELRSDAATGPLITADPELLGVESLGPDTAVLRIGLETRPGAQFTVRRAYLGRVAAAERRGELRGLGADPGQDDVPEAGEPPVSEG